MTTDTRTQREQDAADVRRLGFSHLPAATQRRILATFPPEQALDVLASSPLFAVGDRVGLNDSKLAGRSFTVAKVNPTTYSLDPVGGGRGVRAPHDMVCAPPAAGDGPAPAAVLARGTLVRYTGPATVGAFTPGTLAVVLDDRGGDRVTVAKLGGTPGDRALKAARMRLVVVDPAEVLR